MNGQHRRSSTEQNLFAGLESLHLRSLAGDMICEEKLAGLIREYGFQYARKLFGFSREQSEDFAQEIFLTYVGRRTAIDNIRYWLLKVSSSLSSEFLRESYRWKKGKDLSERYWYFAADSPEEEIINRLQARASMRSINRREGLIVYLRIWRELSFVEIARKVNLKTGHVKQLYYRAIEELAGTNHVRSTTSEAVTKMG